MKRSHSSRTGDVKGRPDWYYDPWRDETKRRIGAIKALQLYYEVQEPAELPSIEDARAAMFRFWLGADHGRRIGVLVFPDGDTVRAVLIGWLPAAASKAARWHQLPLIPALCDPPYWNPVMADVDDHSWDALEHAAQCYEELFSGRVMKPNTHKKRGTRAAAAGRTVTR